MSKKDHPVFLQFEVPALPDHVTIGPFVYDVSFDRVDLLEAQDEEKQGLHGRAHHARQEIVIDDRQAGDQQRETLLHEVLHTLFHQYGINWGIDDDREEQLIRQLSPALFAMLVDNPELVGWLQS